MNGRERTDFIVDFMGGVTQCILSRVADMPDTWGTIELRQYCADFLRAEIGAFDMDLDRERAYRSDMATRPL